MCALVTRGLPRGSFTQHVIEHLSLFRRCKGTTKGKKIPPTRGGTRRGYGLPQPAIY